jgi:hypothetical protein
MKSYHGWTKIGRVRLTDAQFFWVLMIALGIVAMALWALVGRA